MLDEWLGVVAALSDDDRMGGGASNGREDIGSVSAWKIPSGAAPQPSQGGRANPATVGW